MRQSHKILLCAHQISHAQELNKHTLETVMWELGVGVGCGGVTTRSHALDREQVSPSLLCWREWRGHSLSLEGEVKSIKLLHVFSNFRTLSLGHTHTPEKQYFLNSKQPHIKCVFSYQPDIKIIHTQ